MSSLMKSKKSIVIGLVEVYRGVPVDFGHPVHRPDSDPQIGLVYGIERMATGFGWARVKEQPLRGTTSSFRQRTATECPLTYYLWGADVMGRR